MLVGFFLEKKPNLDIIINNGRNLLHAAADKAADVFDLITEKGASITTKDYNGNLPLHILAGIGYDFEYRIEDLTSQGLKLSREKNKNGDTPLHIAAAKGSTMILEGLLDLKDGLNVKDALGNTSLHIALLNNRFYAAELIIESKTDVNLVNNEGNTAINILAKMDSEDKEILKIGIALLDNGANIDVLSTDKEKIFLKKLQQAIREKDNSQEEKKEEGLKSVGKLAQIPLSETALGKKRKSTHLEEEPPAKRRKRNPPTGI